MLCSSTHKLVALVACGCGLDLGCVGGGLSWSVSCPYPCFPCCIMPHKSSMGINAAWHSLISMVIIVMHRTHDRLWLTLWTAEEANGGAWNIAVACSCMAGRQGLAKPITWQENILIGPINHAPNGSQSQDPGLTPLDLVHRFGRSGADGVVNQRCSKRWSTCFPSAQASSPSLPIHFQLQRASFERFSTFFTDLRI